MSSRTRQTDQTALPPRPLSPAPRDRATKSWRREPYPPVPNREPHEREPIAKLIFRLIVGEIVERLQHQSLEDHDFIPRLASRQTLARRIARAKLALDQRRLQLRPERFEGKHRRNRYERITLFVETFIASDQIEEAKLSLANIPRSESRSFESDLRGG